MDGQGKWGQHYAHFGQDELTVEGGCLLWGIHVVVPHKLQARMLRELHHDHPCISRMKSLVRGYLWWPGLDKDIEEVVRACQPCQSVKHVPAVAPLHPWVWPTNPWQHVHLDFAGPFMGSMFLPQLWPLYTPEYGRSSFPKIF